MLPLLLQLAPFLLFLVSFQNLGYTKTWDDQEMIHGAGYAALIVFLILGSQIAAVGTGLVLIVYVLLMIALGAFAYSWIQMPKILEDGEAKRVLAFLSFQPKKMIQELEQLCATIRRDGLLASESARKELSDSFLRYLIKRVADGFDRVHLVQSIRNQSMRVHEIASFAEAWIENTTQAVSGAGLITTLFLMMSLLKSNEPSAPVWVALMPLLLGLVLQPIVGGFLKNRFFTALDHARLYFVLMEEGVSSIQEGVAADMLRDKLNCRLFESPKLAE
jgi:flagellar motor component MotA